MTITFVNTSNEFWDVDKKYTTVSTVNGASVVYPCDILQPTFKIKGGKINANAVTGVFGRNYWITGQTINEGINYISCVVDAFSSFANDIYGSDQFVDRSEKYGNPFLLDGQFPLSNKNEIDMYSGNTIIKANSQVKHVIGVI